MEYYVKMAKGKLEKISDADIYLFIEKGMRGGIIYSAKRYSKANNQKCPNYDKEKPEIYINYVDMNNLSGGAMRQYLPYGGFKWVKTTNETVNRILKKYIKVYVVIFWKLIWNKQKICMKNIVIIQWHLKKLK